MYVRSEDYTGSLMPSDDNDVMFVTRVCVSLCVSQSSIYSLTLKSIISLSTMLLVGLIIAYHCCEVQVTNSLCFGSNACSVKSAGRSISSQNLHLK